MALIFDGIEIMSVSDFASEQGHSAQAVAGWVKKRQEAHPDFKPITTIGNTVMFATAELLAAKNEFGRTAKPKPPSQEQYDSLVSKLAEKNDQLTQADQKILELQERLQEMSIRAADADRLEAANKLLNETRQQEYAEYKASTEDMQANLNGLQAEFEALQSRAQFVESEAARAFNELEWTHNFKISE